jgi:hypothetical protein
MVDETETRRARTAAKIVEIGSSETLEVAR